MRRASRSSRRRLVHRLDKVIQICLGLKINFTGGDIDRIQTKSARCKAAGAGANPSVACCDLDDGGRS
jgi:hypothetical protein